MRPHLNLGLPAAASAANFRWDGRIGERPAQPATAFGNTRSVSDAELIARVRDIRDRLGTVGPSKLRSDGDFERVSIPQSDADALRDLLITVKATTVIEIGLAYASSALAIAEAILSQPGKDKAHLIIDPYQAEFHDAGWSALSRAGLSEVCQLLRERSQLALPRLVGEGFRADAAFVDGSHAFHNVFVDLFFLSELVRPDGLVVIDDYRWPSVATAVGYFEINTGWRQEPIHQDTRLRAYRLPNPPVDASFETFVPFGIDTK